MQVVQRYMVKKREREREREREARKEPGSVQARKAVVRASIDRRAVRTEQNRTEVNHRLTRWCGVCHFFFPFACDHTT